MKEYLFLDNFHHCGFNRYFIDDDGTAHEMLRRKKVKKTSKICEKVFLQPLSLLFVPFVFD